MTFDFNILPPSTIQVRVEEAPSPDVSHQVVEKLCKTVLRGEGDNLLLDFSGQRSSNLTSELTRNYLVSVDAFLSKSWARRGGKFPIAILALGGTFGYGIGRMILGHAYGLKVLELDQFEDRQAALDWLNNTFRAAATHLSVDVTSDAMRGT